MAEAGVKTRMDLYRGPPNVFVQIPQLKSTLIVGEVWPRARSGCMRPGGAVCTLLTCGHGLWKVK